MPGISANNSGFTSGNPPAPEGTQVAFLQRTGSFTQTVTGWAAGSYVLTFDAAQRGNYQASQQDFQVLVDGTVVGTFTPSGTSYQSYSTAAFTVTAGSHTITFQGLDSAGGDNTAFVDAVALASPSPIGDPGFEQVQVGAGHYQYRPTGSPWTFSGNSGISANNSGFTSGNPPAPQGTQVAFLQTTGSFTQTVTGWAAGSYVLTFDAAQRGNYQASRQDFEVLVDGTVISTFTPSGTSYQSYSTAAFTVTAGSHTITFQGLDSAGGDNTAFVDAVAVTGQPVRDRRPGFEQVQVGAGQLPVPARPARPGPSPAVRASAGNNSGFTSGNPPAPQGTQVAFLQTTGSFSQTVAGWAAGSYVLTFDAAQRGNYQASRQDFQVLVDGTVVGTFTPSGTSYQSYSTAAFTVTAGSHTIKFQGLDSAGGDNTAFVDQVAAGITYYASPRTTSGSGTFANPFGLPDLLNSDRSPGGLAALQPGDTLVFEAGNYHFTGGSGNNAYVTQLLGPTVSGTPTRPITLEAYPGATVNIYEDSGFQPVFGTSYPTLNLCTVHRLYRNTRRRQRVPYLRYWKRGVIQ